MFAWTAKLTGSRWTRSARWSRLLSNQREFQRILSKERSRVDRHGGLFGVIILRLESLSSARSQTVRLARLLHKRLRDTDEKGHLGPGRIGIMLPQTNAIATHGVLENILELAAKAGLLIDGEAFVYPDQDEQPPTPFGEAKHDAVQLAGTASGLDSVELDEVRLIAQPRVRPVPLAMLTPKYPVWKRCLDITGGLVGLTLSAPVLVAAFALIRMTSRGPVLFCQSRTGYLGKTFTIYKLRSMIIDAESQRHLLSADNERDGPAFKMAKDPRVTRIGRFLRATGLDELPQFYNVLRGDMSLVGPRPLPVFEADQCNAWQKQRQLVKPGLTCYWQLVKSRQVSFETWMRLDMHYAKRASILRDLRLIGKTFASVFLGRVGH